MGGLSQDISLWDTLGFTWIYMELYGFIGIYMELYGFIGIYNDLYGFMGDGQDPMIFNPDLDNSEIGDSKPKLLGSFPSSRLIEQLPPFFAAGTTCFCRGGEIPVPMVSIFIPFRPKAAWVSVPLKFPDRCSTSRCVDISLIPSPYY